MKHNELLVAPAQVDDIGELAKLIASLFAHEPDFQADLSLQEKGLAMLVADSQRSLVLAARLNGRVVGMVTVQLVISTAMGGWSGLLEDMVVHEEFRGHGVGRALMQAAEAWCVERGAARIQLLADRENTAALSFYNSLGWEETRMICRRRFTN